VISLSHVPAPSHQAEETYSTDHIGNWAGARTGLMSQNLHAKGKQPHSTDRIEGWAGARTGLVTLRGGGGGGWNPCACWKSNHNSSTIQYTAYSLHQIRYPGSCILVDRHPCFRRTCYLCHQSRESGPLKGWHLLIYHYA
jgi:hypothetical protein